MNLAVKARPDLGVAASILGADVEHPAVKHVANVKRVLRYLRGPTDKEMTLKPGKDNQLSTYVDTSWESSAERNRKSLVGMVILYGDAVIYTSSYTQTFIAMSSTEA